MKIGICDDEKEQGLITKTEVDACIGNINDCKVEVYDPYNLDFDLDANRFDCDLLITDIQFENCNFDGIDLAHKINNKCPNCKIIFLSNYLEYGPKVYETEHVWFVWKENMKTLLKKAIQKAVFQEMEDAKPDTIEFFSEGKKTFVRQKDVMYVERNNRHIEIVTNSNKYICGLSLAELSKQLNDTFERATGGCIVNLEYVKSVIGKSVELDKNKKLTLGRKFEGSFRQAYLAFVAKWM